MSLLFTFLMVSIQLCIINHTDTKICQIKAFYLDFSDFVESACWWWSSIETCGFRRKQSVVLDRISLPLGDLLFICFWYCVFGWCIINEYLYIDPKHTKCTTLKLLLTVYQLHCTSLNCRRQYSWLQEVFLNWYKSYKCLESHLRKRWFHFTYGVRM